MIILKFFLYLICIISVGWSVLVFGGPPIIKRLISGYSEGALTASDITVSTKLGVNISRLDFIFQDEIVGSSFEGFSRATEISWSLFGGKPFLEVNLGPSVIEGYAAKSVKISTPSFQEINWKDIALAVNISELKLNSFGETQALMLKGNLKLASTKLSNVDIEAQGFNFASERSTFSANIISSELSELSLKTPLKEQFVKTTILLNDVAVSEPNFIAPKVIIDVLVTKGTKDFKIDAHEVELSEFGGFIENIKIDGNFDQLNVLQGLNLDVLNGTPFRTSPKFQGISASLERIDSRQYKAKFQGSLSQFEMSSSNLFIGSMPSSTFVVDVGMDSASSKVTARSTINFNTSSAADIDGSWEIGFGSESFMNFTCLPLECELSDFNLYYNINVDGEWIRGSADCPKYFCRILAMEHSIKTSDTVTIFKTLSQNNILNPISSIYLYRAISAGHKIKDGHELKFQF